MQVKLSSLNTSFKILMLLIVMSLTIKSVSAKEFTSFRGSAKTSEIDYLSENLQTFVDIAGLGYCTIDIVTLPSGEITIPSLRDHKYITGQTFSEQYDWSYHILANERKQQIVLTFSGTKDIRQLYREHSTQEKSRRIDFTKPQELVMQYFGELFQSVQSDFFKSLSSVSEHYIKFEFLFIGHSLGGAMATIFAYKSIQLGYLDKGKNRPILVTFGQPRVGNYAFSNEVFKSLDVIYRVVQDGDIIPDYPPCRQTEDKICENEYLKPELDKEFSAYDEFEILVRQDDFLPWHIPGLIISPYKENKENILIDCHNASENSNCYEKDWSFWEKIQKNLLIVLRHTTYFNKKVGKICRESYKQAD